MITVILLNESNIPHIPELVQFQTWVNAVCCMIPNKIPVDCNEINIAIVDAVTSAQLNKTYRNKNNPTNVLSFNYEPMPGIPSSSLGDLAICAEIVESEAFAQGQTALSHWAHLTIHGMLHLLGFDHIVESDAVVMEALEINILKTIGFNNPYE